VTAELATFVAGRLEGDRVRRMFDGWGISREGEMVAIVYDERTYIKATTMAAQTRFIAAGMGPFRPRPGQTFTSFWEIPPDVLDDARKLATWTGHPEKCLLAPAERVRPDLPRVMVDLPERTESAVRRARGAYRSRRSHAPDRA